MESIDLILKNLKENPNYYNFGCSEEEYLRIEQRD